MHPEFRAKPVEGSSRLSLGCAMQEQQIRRGIVAGKMSAAGYTGISTTESLEGR